MEKKLIYLLCGGVAGFFSGLLGGGGGALLVPLLLTFGKLSSREALATSVSVIVPLCLCSAVFYGVQGNLEVMLAIPFCVGGAVGGILGGYFFPKANPKKLKVGFAVLLILSGLRGVLL